MAFRWLERKDRVSEDRIENLAAHKERDDGSANAAIIHRFPVRRNTGAVCMCVVMEKKNLRKNKENEN